MNNIQLSICIPTYNREKYLKDLLDCILNQLKDIEDGIVEICVSDNSSTDNTQSMMLEYQQKYNNITYFRWDKNMGADMNYLKVVEIAHGKYCWFFGSDDLMVDGAIKKMLEEIKEDCDIYLCNRYQCNVNMEIASKYNLLEDKTDTKIFKCGSDDEILKYLQSVNCLEGFFSYLSSIVFKKKKWNSIEFDKSFIDTAYAHTYILLSLLKRNIKLKYIKEAIVLYRGENDSFVYNGIINRIKLDFDGYKKLFTTVFSHNKDLSDYYKIILRKYYSSTFIAGIYQNSNESDKKLLLSFIKETHCIYKIKFISIFYSLYRKCLKQFLQKINIHNKIVKLLFK